MRASFLESDNAALKEELLIVNYFPVVRSMRFWEELQTLKEKLLVVQMHKAAAGKQLNPSHQ